MSVPPHTPARGHRRGSARDLAQIAVFAALIAAMGVPGSITLGALPVPITLQTLAVMLCGAILGARKGFLAVLLFCALAAAGLPVLSGGRGGISWFTTAPSAGYFYGWLLGVAVIGFLTARILPRYRPWLALAVTGLGGIVAIYAIGVPVTAFNTHTPLWAAVLDCLKFLPGDAVKVVVTVLVARQVHRAHPGLMARPARTAEAGTASRRPEPAAPGLRP
ncbi:biotin transporter BioY [Arthrobacter sp. SDTb3-6]|uniref:biotin transporter BioY n=1 Tax=Arthrobacter sp. SDTb3-6 TaxID=2713571 RepID=UPI00159D4A6C|nr:biotin transporter BioY [Arthrobacter sp. SDTb3-6]NVN00660.1 biotin transporter BioY [Arthrobacter sp. SDTb3-6]